jgi:hypothetical protein
LICNSADSEGAKAVRAAFSRRSDTVLQMFRACSIGDRIAVKRDAL